MDLLKIFKRDPVAVQVKGKTTSEIVEEIHEDFYTEVDKLLLEAKVSHSLETTKQGVIDKGQSLYTLGFANTKEAKEGREETDELVVNEKMN